MEKRYLLIQSSDKGTVYTGPGQLGNWKEKLGKKPDDERYRVTEVVQRRIGVTSFLCQQTFNFVRFDDYNKPIPNEGSCLEIDERSASFLKQILDNLTRPEAQGER